MTSEDHKAEGRSDESVGVGGFSGRDLESRSNSFDSRVLGSEDLGFWESPRSGLEHCNSVPVRLDSKSSLYKDYDLIFSRSKTNKKESLKYELDRLSSSEKKKIIEDLVKFQNDGTVEVDVERNAPVASELLELDAVDDIPCDGESMFEFSKTVPILKIAILVVGTRGDVQPFIAIAKRLQEFGHRVRLATHVNFRSFVQSHGIEFYPLGGDPRIMAGYMARNKGFLLSGPAEINLQRRQLKEVIDSLLPACTEPDLETGAAFKAQAIIANPPAYDWGVLVDVVGYCFLSLGIKYQPQKAFAEWIQQGPKPIYIGFGSMPLEDGKRTMSIILETLKETGQRAIIGRGWGELGLSSEIPADVFLIEDCPHDWLFPQCAAVVHHGGAGTTATGLRAGCPTTIIPFFGDQFFWGDRIHEKGVGPAPIPIYELNVERLSNSIRFMLDPEVKLRTMELAKEIENEDGVAAAVDAFHRHLPPELPIPPVASEEPPQPLRWLFHVIERWCCLPFSS